MSLLCSGYQLKKRQLISQFPGEYISMFTSGVDDKLSLVWFEYSGLEMTACAVIFMRGGTINHAVGNAANNKQNI